MVLFPRFLPLLLLPFALAACGRPLHFAVHFSDPPPLLADDAVVFRQQSVGRVIRVEKDARGGLLARVEIAPEHGGAATVDSRFYADDDPDRPGHQRIEIEQDSAGGRPIPDGATVEGRRRLASLIPFGEVLDSVRGGLQELGERLREFSDALRDAPDSPEARKLRQEWQRLQEELDQARRETDKALREKLIPDLEKELDELRRRFDSLPPGPRPPRAPEEPQRHEI
jgi:hypothetical protein